MAKTESESLIAMINAAYRIRIGTAKSDQEKIALEKERLRLIDKAQKDVSSLRWYHFAQLESKGAFWDIVSLRKPLNLGSIALDSMREKIAVLTKGINTPSDIDRSVEPKLVTEADAVRITETVIGALVPSAQVADNVSTVQAGAEVAIREQPEPSFSYTYGVAQGNEPAKTAIIQGFANLEELIEAIADAKRTRALGRVLNILRPQSGEDDAASYKFAALLLEGIGNRMVQPMTNAQFLNLQVYVLEGIKQLRPEIDPDNAYGKFIEELGAHLKAQAKKDDVAEPLMLADMTNIQPITDGVPSVDGQNRDILRRTGVQTGQQAADVLPMYVAAMRHGLLPPQPSLPDRIAKLADDMVAASSAAHGPNP